MIFDISNNNRAERFRDFSLNVAITLIAFQIWDENNKKTAYERSIVVSGSDSCVPLCGAFCPVDLKSQTKHIRTSMS